MAQRGHSGGLCSASSAFKAALAKLSIVFPHNQLIEARANSLADKIAELDLDTKHEALPQALSEWHDSSGAMNPTTLQECFDNCKAKPLPLAILESSWKAFKLCVASLLAVDEEHLLEDVGCCAYKGLSILESYMPPYKKETADQVGLWTRTAGELRLAHANLKVNKSNSGADDHCSSLGLA